MKLDPLYDKDHPLYDGHKWLRTLLNEVKIRNMLQQNLDPDRLRRIRIEWAAVCFQIGELFENDLVADHEIPVEVRTFLATLDPYRFADLSSQ